MLPCRSLWRIWHFAIFLGSWHFVIWRPLRFTCTGQEAVAGAKNAVSRRVRQPKCRQTGVQAFFLSRVRAVSAPGLPGHVSRAGLVPTYWHRGFVGEKVPNSGKKGFWIAVWKKRGSKKEFRGREFLFRGSDFSVPAARFRGRTAPKSKNRP